jgi:hypothetical protein
VVGVFALKPLYVIQAWFESSGSTWIAVGKRGGSFVAVGSSSIRSKTTAVGTGLSAFFETKTRPACVAAQSVPLSWPRWTDAV